MYKVKKYLVAIGNMLLVSIASLLVLSTLVYLFKWQSDMAMIGIIVTYVLAGLSCVLTLRRIERESRLKMIFDTLITSVFFIVLLRVVSLVVKP